MRMYPHYLLAFQRNNPRRLLGEQEQTLQAFRDGGVGQLIMVIGLSGVQFGL